ncbi:hypothetical protein TSUD_192660 [Trifolium subterraneum]|uniref:F-box domain-containing protein n=1 Tax=Trifolium subterraneum TaxID=3900 RepID=A0A2Z6LW82_TRISU|nr:hypothetical protein TSUD_192660 [Trifolium subterraneum]
MSRKSIEILDDCMEGEKQKNVQKHAGDSSLLIPQLGHDTSINCLVRLSRSDYGSIAVLNQSFRSLVKNGELYQLRRKMGIIEHWVYFSCDVLKWEAFDPNRDRLMQLPKMSSNTCFMLSDKESLAVDTGTWEVLPDMNTPRRMCSAVFMDGKFYVLGGVGVDKTTQLTCGEEFDLKTRKWRKIPDMCPTRNGGDGANSVSSEAPPLIAVVNNVLFAADYTQQVVKKYVKDINSWVTIGSLPDRVTSLNGWGMAFRSCGDKLVVIGGPSLHGGMATEVNAWVVDEGAPQWNLLAIIQSGSFVYNCAVMGC